MKKSFFLPMVAVALLASCSSDMELSQTDVKFDGKVTLSAPAYEYEDGTRTTLTSSESGISFAWDDDETIGIFPIAPTTNAQAYQKLNGGSGDGTKSSFDGAGWALIRGNRYAAYYPFQDTKATTSYRSIPIDMTGQTQDGNGSLSHIGAGYDYMYATATVPQNGNVNFDFKHVCSIVKLELTMPVAATWKSVTLSSESSVFIQNGFFDITDGRICFGLMTSSIVLNLNNVKTTSANKKLELYLAVYPVTTGDLTITVRTSANYDYTAKLSSKTLKAGKAYQWTATPVAPTFPDGDGTENGHAWIDLGLSVKWATMNVGATSPEEFGNYYSWGDIKTSDHFTIYQYKWYDRTSDAMTKYCANSESGTVDNKTTLEAEDDVACEIWGGKWRMPTHTEQEELLNNCYWVWTDNYNSTGKAGYIVYKVKSTLDKGCVVYPDENSSKDYSFSDSHIFLPHTGRYSLNGYYGEYYSGYWSSSLWVDKSAENKYSYALGFYCVIHSVNKEEARSAFIDERNNGLTVRAVCK